jgi:hypothetical protein
MLPENANILRLNATELKSFIAAFESGSLPQGSLGSQS